MYAIFLIAESFSSENAIMNYILYVNTNKNQQINVFFIAYSSIISMNFSIFVAYILLIGVVWTENSIALRRLWSILARPTSGSQSS